MADYEPYNLKDASQDAAISETRKKVWPVWQSAHTTPK